MLPPPLPVGLQPLPHEAPMVDLPIAAPLDRWTVNGRISVPYTRAVFWLPVDPDPQPSRSPSFDPIQRALQVWKKNKMHVDPFRFQ